MSSTEQRQTPVRWAQRGRYIIVNICVEDLADVKLNVTDDRLTFSGVGGLGDKFGEYACSLDFYAAVRAESLRRNSLNSRQLELEVDKQQTEWWPRLVKKRGRTPWINVDFHRWKDQDDFGYADKQQDPWDASKDEQKERKAKERRRKDDAANELPRVSDASDDDDDDQSATPAADRPKTSVPLPEPPRKVGKCVEAQLDLDGVIVNYARAGRGSHHVLCLPHTPGGWRSDFKETLEEFDHDLFTIVAWDPPGLGKSRPPSRVDWMTAQGGGLDNHYTVRDAQTAHGLMAELGLLPYSVLAWGEGGKVALHLAATQLDSRNVRKLVLWATTADVGPEQIKLYKTDAFRDTRRWSERAQRPYLNMYSKKYLQSVWTAYLQDQFRLFNEHNGDVCKRTLKDVYQPVLILQGEADYTTPNAQIKYLKDNLVQAKTAICMNAGANIQLRNFQWFRTEVKRFLIGDAAVLS